MSSAGRYLFIAIWQLGAIATAIYLIFLDGYNYTWWNWILAVPISLFLAEIWPLYWLLIRPLMH
jgi:hypothetical protein